MKKLLILILLSSCVDPFNFSSQNQEKKILVVDGFITNEKGEFTITLTRSANFYTPKNGYSGIIKEQGFIKPESKAIIKIIDDTGRSQQFLETKENSGIYKIPSSENWEGEIEKKYYIHIKTENGEEYESTPEVLKASLPIDSIYTIYESKELLDENNNITTVDGFQYYADINLGENDNYYAFGSTQTYMIETPIHRVPLLLPPYPKFCYVTQKGNDNYNFLVSNIEFNTQKIIKHPLDFVVPKFEYNIKHSYNLLQYSMSKEAFHFYSSIRKQLKVKGSILDETPLKIIGNISNVHDKNEIVLGYFAVFGVTTKRLFVSKDELPVNFKKGQLSECFVACPPPRDNCLDTYCFDCSKYPGSATQKPSFWE